MAFRPLNVVGGWYTDDALPWVQQDICNFIPVISEMPGPISAIKAVDAPGLKPFVEIASNGGVRGLHDAEGKLMVVAGTRLYQITNTGFALPCGAIPGSGPVTMSHNQQGIANEVLIGNGSAGYVYNTATRAFSRITDPGFPGIKASDYLDSFLLGVEPLGRFWFHSDLADAESYNTLDRYEAETSPDRIVTLAVSNEEVVVLGERTTDFFVNTGAATGTFQSKGVSCNVGCAGTNSIVKLDNTLMWLDNYGVFQRLDGYTPTTISTRALESAIAPFKDRWSGAIATTYQDRGRKIAYWTIPNGPTFGYDVTTRLWHRLASYGRTNFRAPQIVYWNKKWIAGDTQTGRLYELDWDYMLDVDQPHVRGLKTAPLHGNGVKLQMHAARLVFDTGGPETVAIPFPVQPPPDTPAPTITGAAPDGTIGAAYAGYAYTVTGDAPLEVTMASGALPAGLEVSASGVISPNITTVQGTSSFALRVTDGYGRTATLDDSISILYGSPLAVGSIGFFSIYSGVTSAYPLAQSLTFGSESATSVSATEGGSYVARASANSPYFRLFKQNELGAYTEVPTPLDTMPSATLERVALTSDGAYLATAQGTTWRLYSRSGDTFTLVQTVTGFSQCGDLKWTGDAEYLAGSSFSGVKVFRRAGDVLTLLTYAGSTGSTGIAWYGYRLAHAAIGDNQGVRVASVAGDTITTLANATFSSPELALIRWSLDGQTLFMGGNSSGNRLRVYQWSGVAFSARTDPTEQPTDQIKSMDLSADGRVLSATCGENGAQIRVYAVSGQSLALLSVVGADADTENASATFLDSSVHWT